MLPQSRPRSHRGVTSPREPAAGEVWDVVVIGGGAAGLSAAIFTGRAGLRTLVLDRGRSAIRQCAHLENFLGFPGGVDPHALVGLGREQARLAGCEILEEQVTEVHSTPEGFSLRTREGGAFEARRVLAASVYDKSYLRTLSPELHDADEWRIPTREGGRTPVPGLYAAGRITGVDHQAIVSAGHGAAVALALIRDAQEERFWRGYAEHFCDWIVHEGRWGSPEWHEDVDARISATVPEGADVPGAVLRRAIDSYKADALTRCIGKDERARRVAEGRARVRSHLEHEGT